jgi:Fic family protein
MPTAPDDTLQSLLQSIAAQKAELDALRPLSIPALKQLQAHYDVELTYTSNAIEGNTLTLRETAEVIQHGITVGGKSIRDHLEALDHYDALQWIRAQAEGDAPFGEAEIVDLHRRIVLRSLPAMAGDYSPYPRRIAGSPVIFPNPAKLPDLMDEFGRWLHGATGPMTDAPFAPPWATWPAARVSAAAGSPDIAFLAHFRLTAIHPFGDGNGRTARLLMNMLLLRMGYPPVAIGPEHRRAYLAALEEGSIRQDLAAFQRFMHGRLDETLRAYLAVLREG